MLITFIIPAFNASETIIRCLDSIYRVPLERSDFEIIIVDDCSTDNTVDIIKEYSLNHPNLKLLVQLHNHRQGAARNRGLSVARGDYIVFVDSDDEVSTGIKSAVLLAEMNSLEMTIIRGVRVTEGGVISFTYELSYDSDKVFSGMDFQVKHPFWCTGPVLYIYNKSFIFKVNYPFAEDVYYEDSDFVSVHLYNAKRMGYCNECGYIIHENPNSTTRSISFKHVCDYAILGTRMLSFYGLISDKKSYFANSILEGGSYNIMRSCKDLFKLRTRSDVQSFYERFDQYANRKQYVHFREPTYCWTKWTHFCLKHSKLTIFIVGFILSTGLLKYK